MGPLNLPTGMQFFRGVIILCVAIAVLVLAVVYYINNFTLREWGTHSMVTTGIGWIIYIVLPKIYELIR